MIVAIGRFLFRHRNVVFPCAIALTFVPGPEVYSAPLLAAALGAMVALVGQSIRVLTIGLDYIIRGGRDGKVYADKLVTGGLFAHCRNPLYLGNLLIVTGLAVAADSVTGLLIAPALFLFAYHCIISAEEEFLLGKFGDEYRAYCARTPRLGVRLRGLAQTVRGMTFHWRRVVVKEYGTPVAWMTGIAVLTVVNLLEDAGYEGSRGPILGLGGAEVVVVAIWLFTWYQKKTRRLVGD